MLLKIAYQFQSKGGDKFSNVKTMLTTLNFVPLPLLNKQNVTVHHLVAPLFNSYSAPHAIFLN